MGVGVPGQGVIEIGSDGGPCGDHQGRSRVSGRELMSFARRSNKAEFTSSCYQTPRLYKTSISSTTMLKTASPPLPLPPPLPLLFNGRSSAFLTGVSHRPLSFLISHSLSLT